MENYQKFKLLKHINCQRRDCVSQRTYRDSIFAGLNPNLLKEILEAIGIKDNQITHQFYSAMSVGGSVMKRQVGCYLGMVVGDALGAPIEFLPCSNNSTSIVIDIPSTVGDAVVDPAGRKGNVSYPSEMYNVFKLKRGQWTDDASMGACLADSLIVNETTIQNSISKEASLMQVTSPTEVDRIWLSSFWGKDIRSRFWNWANNGYNNAFKHCTEQHSPYRSVGLGGNISKSLAAISNKRFAEIPDFYLSATEDSGNGGLMRIAAVPVFYSTVPVELCMKYCGLSSQTTHPGILATRAAEFMGYFIFHAITRPGDDISTAYEFALHTTTEYIAKYCVEESPWFKEGNDTIAKLLASNESLSSTELCWNWKNKKLELLLCMRNRGDSYNGYPNHEGYFGSFCLDGRAMALHSFASTSSFAESLEKCINYRGDADSTASICGQLAGAFYGIDDIPSFILNDILPWDDSENVLRAFMLTTFYRDTISCLETNEASEETIPDTTSSVAEGTMSQSFNISYPDYPERKERPVVIDAPTHHTTRSIFRNFCSTLFTKK